METRRTVLLGMLASITLPVASSEGRRHIRRDGPPKFRRPKPRRRPDIRRPPGFRRRPAAKIRRKFERRARELQRRGEIRPLFPLIRNLEDKTGGAVLDAFFIERGKNRVYVMDVLFNDGQKTKYVMDAVDGKIFTVEEAKIHYGLPNPKSKTDRIGD